MMYTFEFAGISSSDYGIYVLDKPNRGYKVERAYDSVAVPGRNGDLHIDSGRYNNIDLTYQCVAMQDADKRLTALNAALVSKVGYQRLEDSFDPDCYRLAVCVRGLDVTPGKGRDAASADVMFRCKPQLFLKSGEFAVEYTSSGSIYNSEDFTALPLIRIYGKGTLGVGDVDITFDGSSEYVDIDCDIQDAYHEQTNKNASIVLSPNRFPALHPGENGIVLGNGITKVEVTPRWWRI